MNRILKILFFALIVRPVVLVIMGLNIRNREKLPLSGPAIIAANHNSHLDTMVLMSLYPLSQLHKIRPVAAADYFLKNRFMAWFSLTILGIIPIERGGTGSKTNLFDSCRDALDKGHIIILFPEGSRGEPEQMSQLKKGLFYLNKDIDAPITPVVMRGLGRILPRGEMLFVPFNCDVIIGDALPSYKTAEEMVTNLGEIYNTLFSYCITQIEA